MFNGHSIQFFISPSYLELHKLGIIQHFFINWSMRQLLHRQHGCDHQPKVPSVVSSIFVLHMDRSCKARKEDPVRVHRPGRHIGQFKLSARLLDGELSPKLLYPSFAQLILLQKPRFILVWFKKKSWVNESILIPF